MAGLFHGHRFARQRGFADEEILGGHYPQVGRHDGPGVEEDDIAGDDLRHAEFCFLPFAYGEDAGLHALAKGFHFPVRALVEDEG